MMEWTCKCANRDANPVGPRRQTPSVHDTRPVSAGKSWGVDSFDQLGIELRRALAAHIIPEPTTDT
jgi:hypothetical protein